MGKPHGKKLSSRNRVQNFKILNFQVPTSDRMKLNFLQSNVDIRLQYKAGSTYSDLSLELVEFKHSSSS
jgi:hypothetical protein